MSGEVAVRHPKRGKAHRLIINAGSVWTSLKNFEATACDRWVLLSSKNLTERLPVERVDPADLCRRCWPEGSS